MDHITCWDFGMDFDNFDYQYFVNRRFKSQDLRKMIRNYYFLTVVMSLGPQVNILLEGEIDFGGRMVSYLIDSFKGHHYLHYYYCHHIAIVDFTIDFNN